MPAPTTMPIQCRDPVAIVVGLCAHGLGMVRSLYREGVQVIALEANSGLPGTKTRCAQVRIVPDINGVGLLDALDELAEELRDSIRPVLLLTNDRMVETVAQNVNRLSPRYSLSWRKSANALLPLLSKDQVEARCRVCDMPYPKSMLLTTLDGAAEALKPLRFPVIAKPTRPVSPFKTQISDTIGAFDNARARMETGLPIVVQEFIPGDDTVIRFGALYLDQGRVVARFEGRKLRSRPLGHTTIAVSEPDDHIHHLALRFFDGLDLSGPVSLEVKRDPAGTDWVIEPTVGRTDFWAGLCAANGVDLTLIEFLHQRGATAPAARQTQRAIWMNGERDPGAIVWLLRHAPCLLTKARVQGVFFDLTDLSPWTAAFGRFLSALPVRFFRRAARMVSAS